MKHALWFDAEMDGNVPTVSVGCICGVVLISKSDCVGVTVVVDAIEQHYNGSVERGMPATRFKQVPMMWATNEPMMVSVDASPPAADL